MKYIVPEINISKFSVENIVTLSAGGNGKLGINAAMDSTGVSEGNRSTTYSTIGDWVAAD